MSINRLTHLGGDPLPLSDVKAHLRLETDAEDALLLDYLRAAAAHLETITGFAFVSDNYEQTGWVQAGFVSLQRRNILNIGKVEGRSSAIGESNDWQELPDHYWSLEDRSLKFFHYQGQVRVTFRAGPSDDAIIPENLKQALLLLTAFFFENREVKDGQRTLTLPSILAELVAPFREVRL